MIKEIYSNKYIWIGLLTLSIVGGIIGKYLSVKRNEAIDNAEIMYCGEFRDSIKNPSIILVDQEKVLNDYFEHFSGKVKYNGYRFYSVPQGQKVYVLGYSFEGKIARVAVINANSTMAKPAYAEYWIWHEFLTYDSTLVDPFEELDY